MKNISGTQKPQYDTDGQIVAHSFDSGEERTYLLLEPGFILVKYKETGRIRIWDSKNRRLVELAK